MAELLKAVASMLTWLSRITSHFGEYSNRQKLKYIRGCNPTLVILPRSKACSTGEFFETVIIVQYIIRGSDGR